jgi:hypothetical protein
MAKVQSPVIKPNVQARPVNASTIDPVPPLSSPPQEVGPSMEGLQVCDCLLRCVQSADTEHQ